MDAFSCSYKVSECIFNSLNFINLVSAKYCFVFLLLGVAAKVLANHGSFSCVHVVDVSSYCVDLSIVS